MKKEVITIETKIKDIILEIEYTKEKVEVWVTREDFAIKVFMWGIPKNQQITKKQLAIVSTNELLRNFSYYKKILEL